MTKEEQDKMNKLMQYAQMGDNPAQATAGWGTFPVSPGPAPSGNLESFAIPNPEIAE